MNRRDFVKWMPAALAGLFAVKPQTVTAVWRESKHVVAQNKVFKIGDKVSFKYDIYYKPNQIFEVIQLSPVTEHCSPYWDDYIKLRPATGGWVNANVNSLVKI